MAFRVHERLRSLIASREAQLRAWGKRIAFLGVFLAFLLILVAAGFSALFGPPGAYEQRAEFLVEPEESLESVAERLKQEGLVKHPLAFQVAYRLAKGDAEIRPGGYQLAPHMDALAAAKRLGEAPYLSWIVIPEGKRKEEVAELLAASLGWTPEQQEAWLAATVATTTFSEGVFYPDLYLIPSDQDPAQIAARMRDRFAEATAVYAADMAEETLTWEEVVVLASLVEREAAKNDKPLVAGILRNRIDRGMLLQVDATLQYVRGEPGRWWPIPDADDKDFASPFNTYVNDGLPPSPIATPSLASIEAVLNPQATKCLYYLHDSRGRIHCSTNYQSHVANVNRYLR